MIIYRSRCHCAVAAIALFLVASTAPRAQSADTFDAVVQPFAADGRFMGAVLVARGDDVIFSKAYGSANLEWKIPNDPATKFRIGSITKQFTAALILLLEQDGKLGIQDLLSRHVQNIPASWKEITLFHLLTHTSGIRNFTALPDYRLKQLQPGSPAEVLERLRDEPLDFAPGKEYRYSNSGYLMLGLVIERVAGRPYAQVLQDRIFTPVAMPDSGYDSNPAIIAKRASGYTPSANGPQNAGFIDMTVPHAAGGLYATTGDLHRWARALFGGRVLTPESLQKMTTPNLNNYAFGLGVRDVDGRRMIAHGGGINGFNSFLAYYPAASITVVVLANINGNTPQQIAAALATAAHGK